MKIVLIILSLIIAAETTFLILMKKENNGMSFFKKNNEKEILLSNLKKKGVPVLRLSLEPHLAKWYQVELKNIAHPFFVTPDARFFLVGEVLDSLSAKKDHKEGIKIENKMMLTPQSVLTKKEMLLKIEKQIETLSAYRSHLQGEK